MTTRTSCLMCREVHEPIRTERFMDRHVGVCPLCDKPKLSVDETHQGVVLIACSACGGGAGRFAAALGVATAQIVNAPEKYIKLRPLGSDVNGGTVALGPVPLPDSARVDGWCERLMVTSFALAHCRERGVSEAVIRDCRVGYGTWEHAGGRSAFMFPCFQGGALVGLSLRFWPSPSRDGGRPFNPRGSKATLFPRPPENDGPLLICEGQWDVLAARSLGVEAITSTAGYKHDRLFSRALVRGRKVVVAFDAGDDEFARAQRVARRLRGRAIDMRGFSSKPGYDIGDLARDRPDEFTSIIGGATYQKSARKRSVTG